MRYVKNAKTCERSLKRLCAWRELDSKPGEHRGIFGDERCQFRMRGFEFFNGLF
jgi:hypothetical protein